MDTEETTTAPSTGRRYLPWGVAAGALVFFLITLNWGFTLPGLAALPRITGWDWELSFAGPLLFIVTYPFRWLPQAWQVPALNLMAAACSALTLALLARSVMLLPHDRTREQRQLERSDFSLLSIRLSWLPPIFAVLVCGLQYTFWQHSIVNTGEALDLLCFAYIIRCLLESRIDERDSWLAKAALVYGLSITNNFAMIAFIPLFLGALIWIKGYRLLDSGLLIQIVLWGLAGLLFYFLLPTVNMLSDRAGQTFWEMLRMNLGNQREMLRGVPNWVILLVGLTSILPVIFMGIRWPAQFGDISAAGNALTNLMTHVIHGVFLVACLYVSFDPPFSPRHLAENRQMLPFYYLGAISIGYFAGYFLLIFGQRPHAKTWQRPSPLRLLMNYTVTGLVLVAAVAVPAGLFVQNRPGIQLMSSSYLQEMGELAVGSLPKGKAIVLSDDPQRLYAVEAALARRGERDNFILAHTGSMAHPGYHRYLRQRYPQRWPDLLAERPLDQRIEQKALADFLVQVSKTSTLFYLHPSFGYFFESFYAVPHNMVFELRLYGTNEIAGPPLTAEQVASNFKYWQDLAETTLAPLKMPQEMEKALKTERERILFVMGSMYSRTVNAVGVEFQRAKALKEAGAMFKQALALNVFNPYAYINMEYNGKLQAGGSRELEPSKGATQRLAQYRSNWNAILNGNGPPDEPNSCYLLAEALARGRNYRQAAQQLLRTIEYRPDSFPAHVGLATMMVRAGMADKGMEHLAQTRQQFKDLKLPDEMALVQAEAWAFSKQGHLDQAIDLLRKQQERHPQESGPFGTLAEIYLDAGQITNAMQVFQKQMELQPKNPGAEINYYALLIQNKQYSPAIEGLTRFLEQNPKDGRGRLNRAIAYFLSGNMDKAEIDYRALSDAEGTPSHAVFFGLGEINFRRGQLKEALKQFESYLETAPRDTPEYRSVEERVKDLKRKV